MVRYARERGLSCVFGDATDPEFLASLPLSGANWVVSAIPEHDLGLTHQDPRKALIQHFREFNFPGEIAVSTRSEQIGQALHVAGADLLLLPFRDAAQQAVMLLLEGRAPSVGSEEDPTGQRQFTS